jgi:UDP-N-acetylmuramoyl-tripeptide--D-alanyl-D-alanine ligase
MHHITADQLLEAIGGTVDELPSGPFEGSIGRVVTDSRVVEPGDLFVALPGDRRHGGEYLGDAARRGAMAAVVGPAAGSYPGLACVRVADSLQALWELAAWNRDRCSAVRIAVTGSYAKTTTRQMIHQLLCSCGSTVQSPRNYNNHVGLPLSLLSMDPIDRFGVFEVAASGRGEIGPLAELVRPSVGVLTGLGRAHLGGFGTIESLVREKCRLLESVEDGGLVVVPVECRDRLKGTGDCHELVTVGVETEADIVARGVEHNSGELRFEVDGVRFCLQVAGRHFVTSALLAIAVARGLGIADAQMAELLSTFRTASGRCRVQRTDRGTVIDDSYNASPESMLAACRVLSEWTSAGRRVLVLGDMAELGEHTAACHGELGAVVASSGGIDRLWAAGLWADATVAAAVDAGMPRESTWSGESVEQLLESLPGLLEAGDTVLVKGAREARMERVVQQFCQVEP